MLQVAILTKTELILQAKDPTPSGMRETVAMLEKASVDKSQVDKAKATGAEHTEIVMHKQATNGIHDS